MHPYYNAVVVTVRTVAISLFLYMLGYAVFVSGENIGLNPLGVLMTLAVPVIFYFLAKPIAWLATLGIK